MTRVIAATAMLAALAGPPATAAQPDAPVRIFDAGELEPGRYRVVERLWTGSWRASFDVPVHRDPAAAIAALSAEAVRLGADGITNLVCVNDAGAWLEPGYFCYGLAIKLR